jgi:ssDNA-binding Zn-finger/Zn-ribbon topoisomerase 1
METRNIIDMTHLQNPKIERRNKYRKIVEELYPAILENRKAELGTTIKCPICGKEVVKKKKSDFIPCSDCKDEYFLIVLNSL